jgi:homoserine acetyltransferase
LQKYSLLSSVRIHLWGLFHAFTHWLNVVIFAHSYTSGSAMMDTQHHHIAGLFPNVVANDRSDTERNFIPVCVAAIDPNSSSVHRLG